jgi:hypothetical protein
MDERRAQPRRRPTDDEPIARIRMRTGPELTVIDVSPGGALVEGRVRLLPGARVDVHFMTRRGRLLVRSRVVRAYVSTLGSGGVTYCGGLLFDQAIDTTSYGYSLPELLDESSTMSGTKYP